MQGNHGAQGQIWVTSALTAEDANKALILCTSLRRTYTARKIAIIVSHHIPVGLKRALNKAFDMTFELDEELNTGNFLSMYGFAKLYVIMALRSFETCAYLAPTMLVLRNSDDIFKKDFDKILLLEDAENTSVFLFKPSVNLFEELITGMEKKNKDIILGKYLHEWSKNRFGDIGYVDSKFCIELKADQYLLSDEQSTSIVNLAKFSTHSDVKTLEMCGLLGKLVSIYWHNIFEENVLPLLTEISGELPANHIKSKENETKWRNMKEPIAIVGMSCRYPGANNIEEFWQLLSEAGDGTSNPPEFRWSREQSSNPCASARSTNAGFLKVPVDEFDAKFFGISPMESLLMDPQHRLIHELVWESLEHACINPQSLRGSLGSVFMGSWTNEYKDILQDSGSIDFFRMYMGNSIGAATARISFLLGMTGPSISTEAGCSSAMLAVHLACRSLMNGETNLALVCGINMLLRPFGIDEMPMMVSRDGHSKTFSEDANGFARAEGGGVLVLKRLSDALKDGDRIWGLIRGSATCQEGLSKSLGTPTVECESFAMKEALRDAQVAPEQVSYVEAHGTGTVVGDPLEVAAIAKAYYTPQRKEPLVIGSVKTNVGHTESCSGITGIMKVVLAMQHETIPAHRNFTALNPSIDLNAVPAVIPLEKMEWCRKANESPRIAGVSSFGITGTDAHVIIEEPPTMKDVYSKALIVEEMDERPMHIIKLSAKTEEAMSKLMEKYGDAVEVSEDYIADIAYSANTGRADFPFRAAIVGRNKEEICEKITQQNYLTGKKANSSESVGKICFLFTGQGDQYPGMAKGLYETSPVFRIYFDYCQKILEEVYGIDIKSVLWPLDENSENKINRTIYSQTCIFCVEYALMKMWDSWGVRPDYVLGHSLGEFAAASCAGILSVEDALKLVVERSRLIDQLPQGKMLVVKADQKLVETLMKQFAGEDKEKLLDFAAINSNEQAVVSGDSEVILAFSTFCTNNSIKSVLLQATNAFHSKHMDPILEKYRMSANSVVKLSSQNCSYISGMTGEVMSPGQIEADYWVQHTRKKVNFLEASKTTVELGCRVFLEIGPQPVLSALNLTNNPGISLSLASLKRNEDSWTTMLTSLATLYANGVNIDWSGLDQFRSRKKVRLPHYPFMGKKFWPELVQKTENAIHPLLGSPIPNASSTKLFQSGISLKSHEFIKDHAIGHNVVFPGAGYLEMCLAAGYASLQGSVNTTIAKPMKVENLTIAAPLAVYESKTSLVQTVVEFDADTEENGSGCCWSNNVQVKIHQRMDAVDECWLQHAQAEFSSVLSQQEQAIPFELADLSQILSRPSEDGMLDKMYETFATLGLKFGEHFQSIEKLWRDVGSSNSILAKVKIPTQDTQYTQYVIHPVILDAMIQAIMMVELYSSQKEKKKLHVPVKIGKFVRLMGGEMEGKELYIQVRNDSTGQETNPADCTAVLMDQTGKALAIMSAVKFVGTTVGALESVLEQQIRSMPDLWKEVWRVQNLTEYETLQEERDSRNNTKHWIVFHQEDDPISDFLLKKIPELKDDRNVVSVIKSNKFEQESINMFKVRADNEQDFVHLMEALSNTPANTVEGVVYCWSLEEGIQTQDCILQPYFLLAKALLGLRQSSLPGLYLLTRNTAPVEDNDISNFHASTLWGFTRSLQNENSNLACKCIDVGVQLHENDMFQIYKELWSNDKDTQVAFYDNRRYVPKFIPHRAPVKDLELPMGTDRFQLIIPETRNIGDLKFGPLECFELAPGEIEMQVKSSALNFRDVFSVLKPSEKFKNINAIGFDFAGVVKSVHAQVSKWHVGDFVFGVNVNGAAFPSHVRLHEDDVLPVPNSMTLSEACTLPAVVVTSYHCLIDVAKIKPSDTVLIHTASGGVGLSAIEICKHIGVKIIATAGSKRKQEYLRSLGIKHIFHSRNTEYGDKILEITNGRGVDVVLNSLTSEGFKEATLKACAYGARFVEMSKLNIWEADEVSKLRPDVEYTVVDVSSMEPLEWRRIMGKLEELSSTNIITPIPYVCFNGLNIREALQHLQKAKHIGKVVCTIPEFRHRNGRVETYIPLFNDRSTYLITGGLGGIGFEVCKWMLEKGARHVLLGGRNPPKPAVQKAINLLNVEYSAKVRAVQLDVSDFQQCRELIQDRIHSMGYPPLRGIMHAAGTLRDGLVENQSWETLSSTFGSKIDGTLNLHELTKNSRLEHFVLFSSIATLFGSPGQSNHSAGNSFEDAFAHYRNSVGLPATTVNWGVWGEVGIATEVDLPGIKPFSTLQGISVLEYCLKSQRTQIAAVNISSFATLGKLFPHISSYVDEKILKSSNQNQKSSTNEHKLKTDSFWQKYDMAENVSGKTEILSQALRSILRDILKLEESDIIEDNANFYEMGVDSLMFIEVKNALQSLFGGRVAVNSTALRDAETVHQLAETLVNMIEENENNSKGGVHSEDRVNALIQEDCHLPNFITAKTTQKTTPVDQIATVLLTGCTGTLGPYILKELSARENITKIVCLIRPGKTTCVESRLRKILAERDLLASIDMSKIECIDGNVAMEKLGMEDNNWEELSNKVDAVFHCAASVQHVEQYNSSHSVRNMRAVNVQGTKNILEFACAGAKLKRIYFASSIVAVSGMDKDGNFCEDWPQPHDFNGVTTMAYPVTKFIGDMLMKQAVFDRGFSVKAFRFPLISGDSKTGRFLLEQNHVMLRYLFILKHGMMPSDPMPIPVLPVDICAWASVQLFFDTSAPDDVYNVCNAAPDVDQEFIKVAEKLGYNIETVGFSRFSQKIQEATVENSPFAIFKEFYGSSDLESTFGMYPWLQQWLINGGLKNDFMISKKISKYLPDFSQMSSSAMDHIYRDLLFAKQQGWLDKYADNIFTA